MDLGLEIDETGPIPVVAVRGEIDFGSAPRLRELLVKRAMDGDKRVVLDLAGVDFLDSTGLGVIVGALKRYRTFGGDLYIVVTTDRIRAVFELTGLTAAFTVYDDRAAAVAEAAAEAAAAER
jgi:anti-sigma B factor antagonist